MERTIRSNGYNARLGKAGVLLTLATLTLGAAPVIADDDIGPDEAIRLIEAGTIQSLETLNQTAIALHAGAAVKESELEKEYGRYVYKVELRDGTGVEWDVDLDAATGKVLEDRRDD